MADQEVPAELRREFWTQVVLFNLAVLGVALGVLVALFDGRWLVGAALAAVGLVAGVRGYRRYRRVRTRNG